MNQAAWCHVVRVLLCQRHQQDSVVDCEEGYTVKTTVRRTQAGSSSEKRKACMWRYAYPLELRGHVYNRPWSVSNETGATRPVTQS